MLFVRPQPALTHNDRGSPSEPLSTRNHGSSAMRVYNIYAKAAFVCLLAKQGRWKLTVGQVEADGGAGGS